MKTSSNNNNIESNNQEFFTKGKKYRCIKSVVMKKGGRTAFKAGSIYEQVGEPSHWVGWLRNEQGERHAWPQPVYIAHEVKTWGTKPEDIDPRLYFEPVEDVKEAEGIKVGTEVWTTIELHEEYGKRGKVVRKYFADHGVWCLDIEFEDGTKATYAEEYVTTKKPWAVVGAKCRHKYLNRDVVLTITAVGQYYGIKAESEDGKVKRCGLVRDFEPVEDVKEAEDATLQEASEIKPKAAFQIGDRVERKSDGERGTVDGYGVTDGNLTYIVKYDRAQRRQSDGFEYLSEELNGDELQAA